MAGQAADRRPDEQLEGDEPADRVARQAEQSTGAPSRGATAERERLARLDGDPPQVDPADGLERPLDDVVRTDRHAAGHDHRVGLGEAPGGAGSSTSSRSSRAIPRSIDRRAGGGRRAPGGPARWRRGSRPARAARPAARTSSPVARTATRGRRWTATASRPGAGRERDRGRGHRRPRRRAPSLPSRRSSPRRRIAFPASTAHVDRAGRRAADRSRRVRADRPARPSASSGVVCSTGTTASAPAAAGRRSRSGSRCPARPGASATPAGRDLADRPASRTGASSVARRDVGRPDRVAVHRAVVPRREVGRGDDRDSARTWPSASSGACVSAGSGSADRAEDPLAGRLDRQERLAHASALPARGPTRRHDAARRSPGRRPSARDVSSQNWIGKSWTSRSVDRVERVRARRRRTARGRSRRPGRRRRATRPADDDRDDQDDRPEPDRPPVPRRPASHDPGHDQDDDRQQDEDPEGDEHRSDVLEVRPLPVVEDRRAVDRLGECRRPDDEVGQDAVRHRVDVGDRRSRSAASAPARSCSKPTQIGLRKTTTDDADDDHDRRHRDEDRQERLGVGDRFIGAIRSGRPDRPRPGRSATRPRASGPGPTSPRAEGRPVARCPSSAAAFRTRSVNASRSSSRMSRRPSIPAWIISWCSSGPKLGQVEHQRLVAPGRRPR